VIKKLSTIEKMLAVFAALFLLIPAPRAKSQVLESDSTNSISITEIKSTNCIRVFLSCINTLEATVRINCTKLENMTATHSLPYDFLIKRNYRKFEIIQFRQSHNGLWQCQYNYVYKLGIPSNKATIDYVYALPYQKEEHFTVSQSYLGNFSHFKGSQVEYAIDFRMPEGTKVLAAREGTVIAFRDNSKVGGVGKEFAGKENLVVIKHDDGTYANYLHLKPGGVLVKLGDRVQRSAPIGLSGATGMATEPHLHFGVYRVKNATDFISLPFQMNTSRGVLKQLEKGQSY
jgi:murein DD-endopeptidase MepM/ murein hydrolase activator NlpD